MGGREKPLNSTPESTSHGTGFTKFLIYCMMELTPNQFKHRLEDTINLPVLKDIRR